MLTIENQFPAAWYSIRGDVHLHESPALPDNLPARAPVNIINTGQNLYVHFRWRESGFLRNSFCGWQFECRVYLEMMGTQETRDNPAPIFVPFNTSGDTYSRVITIPAGDLEEGTYKMIATLLLHDCNGSPTPLAAYDEIGVLQVYESV